MESMDVLIRENRILKLNKWNAIVPYASAIVYAQNGCLGYAEVLVDYRALRVNRVGFAGLRRLSDRDLMVLGLRERFLVTKIKGNKSREAQRDIVSCAIRKEVSGRLKKLKSEGIINYQVN